ncbi:hypothetical protein Hypma_014189 [Hypsizygus marmoreus]|uniref:Uncharacterized protein n=1 Tax=Hypsizygus marmoreus TaxID=39966 RepID=A0A369JID9_HYPMA|nr:hypothetical protein Hypma_014189 [Hypsizygus marmoreus]
MARRSEFCASCRLSATSTTSSPLISPTISLTPHVRRTPIQTLDPNPGTVLPSTRQRSRPPITTHLPAPHPIDTQSPHTPSNTPRRANNTLKIVCVLLSSISSQHDPRDMDTPRMRKATNGTRKEQSRHLRSSSPNPIQLRSATSLHDTTRTPLLSTPMALDPQDPCSSRARTSDASTDSSASSVQQPQDSVET